MFKEFLENIKKKKIDKFPGKFGENFRKALKE